MAGTKIVPMWRIVIHHVGDENGNRKVLCYTDENEARERFGQLRDYWTRNESGHAYKLEMPNGVVIDSFESGNGDLWRSK